MKELEEKILKEGKILPGNVLLVGSFLNQQVDVALLRNMAKEVKRLFPQEITKIVTVEASGIAFATAVALELDVPFVFAKKSKASNLSGAIYSAEVYSFTHEKQYKIFINEDYLKPTDKVLILDDFLAKGEAIRGLIALIEQSGATLVGAAVEIEKVFQNGGNSLRAEGYDVKALASITDMTDSTIKFN